MKALYVVRSSVVPRKDFAQWRTGFGAQLGIVAFPGKIMADSETQKLERKNFFKMIVEKVDGAGGARGGGYPDGPFGEAW